MVAGVSTTLLRLAQLSASNYAMIMKCELPEALVTHFQGVRVEWNNSIIGFFALANIALLAAMQV